MEAHLEANDLWEAIEEDYKVLSLPANLIVAQMKNHKEKKSRKSKQKTDVQVHMQQKNVAQVIDEEEDERLLVATCFATCHSIKMKGKSFALDLLEEEQAMLSSTNVHAEVWQKRLGHFNHAVGILKQIKLEDTSKRHTRLGFSVTPHGISHPYSEEPPLRPIAYLGGFTLNDEFNMPLLVITSGRVTISITSSTKWLATGNIFVVHIQHPRSRLDRFDLEMWITPRRPLDRHVVLTVGALYLVDLVALKSVASVWHDDLAPLVKPFFVDNIREATSSCQYGTDLAK
ncbi:mitochondrial fission protein ELM1-like isoform X2 [Gossypium australe]|uniref:Mitochondrial fission protein ELM1-like isoform X2 n=1 Tax=Gossypium australe TaxID=47621 RepID=A0A5B6V0C3_9ROSI|nr:mitochondrial fission protein ELM1-like isoform X2 [Gossypium australe]